MTDSVAGAREPLPPADRAAWEELRDRALKGASPDTLIRRTADGIARGPLMSAHDGTRPLAPPVSGAPWIARDVLALAAPGEVNTALRAARSGGADAVELALTASTGQAAVFGQLAAWRAAFEGVDTSALSIGLGDGADGTCAPALLAALWEERGAPAEVRGAFNIDPLGQAAVNGFDADALDQDMDAAGAWTAWAAQRRPVVATVRIAARHVHEAGGTRAEEIAWACACGLTYLRSFAAAGHAPDALAGRLTFALAADADIHQTIAALRAFRHVWGRIAGRCRLPDALGLPGVEAVGSQRMLTRRDPWTNLIRLTAAGFAAAAGGADIITLPPHDGAGMAPSPTARRAARNLHHVLRLEAHVARVADPAAGAHHHEAFGEALARAAWGRLQDIERAGGARGALESGLLAEWTAQSREALRASIASGERPIIGVTRHPAPDTSADLAAPDEVASAASDTSRRPDGPVSPDALVASVLAGEAVPVAAARGAAAPPALPPIRCEEAAPA